MKKILLSVVAALSLAAATIAQTVPSYVPTNGLVGWWPFNGNANDESGNGNNGTVNGATLTTDRLGNAGKAYSFDGTSNYIDGQFLTPILTTGNGLTFATWVNFPIINSLPQINLTNNNGSGYGIWSNIVNGNRVFSGLCGNAFVAPSMQINDVNSPSINTWYSVVLTCDLSTSISKLYVNGFIVDQSNAQLVQASLDLFTFGKWPGNNVFLTGNLDDIGIWNRALTQQEITDLYNANTNNVVFTPNSELLNVPFNNNVTDVSTYNNPITATGGFLTDNRCNVPNEAYQFNGTSDYLKVPAANFPSINNSFTYAGWINPETYGQLSGTGYGRLFDKGTTLLFLHETDNSSYNPYSLVFSGYENNVSKAFSISPANSILLNNWQHIAVSFNDSTNEVVTYINGILQGTTSYTFTIDPNTTNDLYIGQRADMQRGFQGKMDELHFFNYALNASQIYSLYVNSDTCHCSISFTSQPPATRNADIGENVGLTISTSGTSANYQWQENNGSGFTNLIDYCKYSGTSSSALNISPATIDLNNYKYRCLVTSGACRDTSVEVLLNVDTNLVTIYDTTFVTITDTNIVYVTDTNFISVTDTLIISVHTVGLNQTPIQNTIKVFPNPASTHVTIDYGNFATLNGYQLKIENSIGQQVFQTNINQQSNYLDLSNWGGNGIYFVRLIDPQGNTVDIRKIVLQ